MSAFNNFNSNPTFLINDDIITTSTASNQSSNNKSNNSLTTNLPSGWVNEFDQQSQQSQPSQPQQNNSNNRLIMLDKFNWQQRPVQPSQILSTASSTANSQLSFHSNVNAGIKDDDQLSHPSALPFSNSHSSNSNSQQQSSGGPSDFVKKLFMMLEDSQYSSVVCWSPSGESFVVKEMNDFTKHILPRHFKHSNFASFVRQLNKYDFHKVKRDEGEEKPWGDQTWEFKHPEFKANCRHLLENIKRKAPTGKSKPNAQQQQSNNVAQEIQNKSTSNEIAGLQSQLESLSRSQKDMNCHLSMLESNYHQVIDGIMNFHKNLIAQDHHMQNLIQYLVDQDLKHSHSISDNLNDSSSSPLISSEKVRHLIKNYKEAASASFTQMNEISKRVSSLDSMKANKSNNAFGVKIENEDYDSRSVLSMNNKTDNSSDNRSNNDQNNNQQHGLRVFTLGQLRPKSSADEQSYLNPSASNVGASTSTNTSNNNNNNNSSNLRIHRSTFVPGWTVPPRVLLVEDDAVCRKLSSKFLQVFGCTIDVADDGVSAVNKMNFTKYDLVLMDIVMPNLDGVAATNLIRQFDPMTPIISMTSNSNPNDILNYFSHGMNDILPKPFTKEGLLGMVEKHLIHLKTMQQLSEIPRALGLPPLNDQALSEALQSNAQAAIPTTSATSASTATTSTSTDINENNNENSNENSSNNYDPAQLAAAAMTSDDGETVNPLASMGMSDENYVNMLQGILASGAVDQSNNFNFNFNNGRNSPVAIATAAAKRALDNDDNVPNMNGNLNSYYRNNNKKTRFEELIE